MQRLVATVFALFVLVLETPSMHAQQYTRGVGVYPGNPAEDAAPVLVPAPATTSRNLALRRPAYHSSSYDYNLTAQLVTDGIKESKLPLWVSTSSSERGGFHIMKARILVVDDEPSIVKLVTAYLRPEGYEVQTAGDVATALELANRESFDLLISDLGSQRGPLVSTAMFHQFVAPYLKEMIDHIHALGGGATLSQNLIDQLQAELGGGVGAGAECHARVDPNGDAPRG